MTITDEVRLVESRIYRRHLHDRSPRRRHLIVETRLELDMTDWTMVLPLAEVDEWVILLNEF